MILLIWSLTFLFNIYTIFHIINNYNVLNEIDDWIGYIAVTVLAAFGPGCTLFILYCIATDYINNVKWIKK